MNAKTLLAATFAALLLAAPAANAQPARDPSALKAEKEARAAAKQAERAQQSGVLPSFPNATRQEPDKLAPKAKMKTRLNKIQSQFEAQDFEASIAGAEEILSDPEATPAEKSRAAHVAAFAASKGDSDNKRASAYAKRALDENGLPNGVHFPLMLELAKMHTNDDQYAEAIAAVDRFLAETKASDPAAHMLRGNALYQLDRYAEAIDALKLAMGPDGKGDGNVAAMLLQSYVAAERFPEAIALAESVAARSPDDKKAQLNLASAYADAEQPEKAVAVFERLRSAGKLTETRDYELGIGVLSKLDGREQATVAFINEGLEKGILKPSAQVYGQLGQSHYNADNLPEAIAAWEKGAPLASNGELYLNLAVISNQADRYAAAKAAAQQAIAKGVRKPGKAWMVIAEAEQGMGNNAAIPAAYREAAKDPATREEAQRMLQKFGGK
jgi:tetratricopeptide (TPR) repeat protein